MESSHIPKEGQLLVGPLFNEPVLAETVRPGVTAVWTMGLVGSRPHEFRRVQLSENDLGLLRIVETSRSFDGDPQLLKVAIQAYALGIAIVLVSKKLKRRRALRHQVIRPHGKPPRLEFEIFEPKNESEVQSGTVSRAKATCRCCNITLPPERVRTQLAVLRGGADVRFDEEGHRTGGAFLLAEVSLSDDTSGRQYGWRT